MLASFLMVHLINWEICELINRLTYRTRTLTERGLNPITVEQKLLYLLSAPSSLLTASTKHSWSSGVHRIRGLCAGEGPGEVWLERASTGGVVKRQLLLHVNPMAGFGETWGISYISWTNNIFKHKVLVSIWQAKYPQEIRNWLKKKSFVIASFF